jgi:hypothetical protein
MAGDGKPTAPPESSLMDKRDRACERSASYVTTRVPPERTGSRAAVLCSEAGRGGHRHLSRRLFRVHGAHSSSGRASRRRSGRDPRLSPRALKTTRRGPGRPVARSSRRRRSKPNSGQSRIVRTAPRAKATSPSPASAERSPRTVTREIETLSASSVTPTESRAARPRRTYSMTSCCGNPESAPIIDSWEPYAAHQRRSRVRFRFASQRKQSPWVDKHADRCTRLRES